MEQKCVSARVILDEYTNKVLGMIKIKYDLRDKSEAINKFIELYGEEIVEKEASDEYLKNMMEGVNEHLEKYGDRKMSLEELDVLFE